MQFKRILLIGAGGQLGQELLRCLTPVADVVPSTRTGTPVPTAPSMRCEALDLTEPDSIRKVVSRVRPEVVINAAAYSYVEQAEKSPQVAWIINKEAVGVLGEACRDACARLLHYSTDYVFSGRNDRPWREDDAPGPLNVYGSSKLAGEDALRSSGCRHMVFRIAWLYSAHSHNFLRTMLRLAHEGSLIRVVDDQCGTPTNARWVAETTTSILAKAPEPSGTWHMAPSGRTTWFGFAREIFQTAVEIGLIREMPRVQAVDTAELASVAHRPAWSVLDTAKLSRDFDVIPPNWRAGVRTALEELASSPPPKRDS